MPVSAVLGDLCTGHGAFPPRASTSGSSNVLINSTGVLRLNDTFPDHVEPSGTPHPGTVSSASATVLINGLGAARTGDAVSCGGTVVGSGSNVIIGG